MEVAEGGHVGRVCQVAQKGKREKEFAKIKKHAQTDYIRQINSSATTKHENRNIKLRSSLIMFLLNQFIFNTFNI